MNIAEQQAAATNTSSAPWRVALGVVTAIAVATALALLRWLDDFTELYPWHDGALKVCLFAAGVAALCAATLWFLATKGQALWRRIYGASILASLAALLGFAIANGTTDLINGHRDFPRGQTRTYPALIQISRAYATHGKGSHFAIQTMPLWSNLDIEESDFRFMRNHRSPLDTRRQPDEIKSNGFFCARVTVEQSRSALRILHAGSRTLPAGTVSLCPTAQPSNAPPSR